MTAPGPAAPCGCGPTGPALTSSDGFASAAPVTSWSVKRIAQALDHRPQDRHRRLQMLAVFAEAIAGVVIELLGHLGVACRTRVTLVLGKRQAARVELRADEREDAADARFLLRH